MGKISYEDKARIDQHYRNLVLDAEQLLLNFREKGWKLCSVKAICKRVDERGSATERKPGSGRPKTARTETNVRYIVIAAILLQDFWHTAVP